MVLLEILIPVFKTLFLASLQLYNNVVTSAAGFKCQNSLISDQWRKGILELINGFRRTVAKGQQLGKDGAKLPSAKKMNQLTWDCNIEAEAQGAAKTCPTSLTSAQLPVFQDTAYKLGYITATKAIKANSCDTTKTAKDLLTEQWNAAVANQPDENVIKGEKVFSQLANEEMDAFACTYQICQTTSYYLLCFFNKKPAAAGAPVYEKETGTKYCTDPDCKYAVASWWKSFENKGFGEDRENKKSLISAANIAYDETTKVGCAIDVGDACLKLGKLYIMCMYDKSTH
ncbi:SCP-like protein [Necator americanus]|uniref:SCP-like protein n=1 Tax=Necator americanus TaxID=51031 RepID=W2TX85_NECAM|nr:SCP-like protein [Necator americanus]ETN85642.1 SCP-like protein [Necator americanus]